MKEKILKIIQNPEFYLLYHEFQTMKIQFFWAKLKKIRLFSIIKHVLGFKNHTGTLLLYSLFPHGKSMIWAHDLKQWKAYSWRPGKAEPWKLLAEAATAELFLLPSRRYCRSSTFFILFSLIVDLQYGLILNRGRHILEGTLRHNLGKFWRRR